MNKNQKYQLNSQLLWAQDEKNAQAHIKHDDYFGTVATVLNLIKQALREDRPMNLNLIRETLQDLEKELSFLQANYLINPNHNKPATRNKNRIPKGKLINQ